MKLFKYAAAVAIAILAFPASWYLAWIVGGEGFMALTFWVPAFGLVYFVIYHLMGTGCLQMFLSWVLALFIGVPTIIFVDSLKEH